MQSPLFFIDSEFKVVYSKRPCSSIIIIYSNTTNIIINVCWCIVLGPGCHNRGAYSLLRDLNTEDLSQGRNEFLTVTMSCRLYLTTRYINT